MVMRHGSREVLGKQPSKIFECNRVRKMAERADATLPGVIQVAIFPFRWPWF